MRRIFVVVTENEGYPEDRTKEVVYVGYDEEKAVNYKVDTDHTLYLEVWKKEKAIAGYFKGFAGEWERNFGEKLGYAKEEKK